MSKVAEIKADIPLTGNGIIINVYSSIEDMSNEYYTNDYILVEAEYDGAYHKECPIAVTYSRNSDAFNEFGTEWVLLDADGRNCYVMTEPYFPTECVVSYASPEIKLCYTTDCDSSITVKPGQTITPTAKAYYTQTWTDSCGNSGTETGTLDSGYIFHVSEDDLRYEFNSSTGEFTAENILAKSGGGSASVGYIYVRASINGVTGTSNSTYIYMDYEDTDDFKDYYLWVWYDSDRHISSETYSITPLYVWCQVVSGLPYYFKNVSPFDIKSYASEAEALAAGRINPPGEEQKGEGYYVLSMPRDSYQFFFTVNGGPSVDTATVSASNWVDLSDNTGDLN